MKESAHMLDSKDYFSWHCIEMNTEQLVTSQTKT